MKIKPLFRPFNWLLMIGSAASFSANAYNLVDLGANVQALDVNDNLTVVGSRNTDQYPTTAFRWTTAGGFENLDGTVANAVNDNEQVTGNTLTGAFFYDGSTTHYIGDDYTGGGINGLGVVAGSKSKPNPYRATPRPVDPALYDSNAHGQQWSVLDVANVYSRGTRQGVYADLYYLYDINDAGYAVGKKSRYGLAGSAAFMTPPAFDSVSFLPIPNGGYATAINNSNMIVGATNSNSSTGEYSYAFLYDGDTVRNLGTLPIPGSTTEKGLTSYAYDVNDSNQVVGSSWLVTALTSLYEPEKYHAFIWEDPEMKDLNDLVQADGWILTRANAINENGDIVGIGLKDGIEHGFLLTNDQLQPPPANQPPVAVISATPTSGRAPLEVSFDGTGSSDPDVDPLTYSWDFGDGSTSIEPSILHTYSEPGTYIAILTVTDNQELDTAQIEIVVKKGGPKN